MSNEEGIIDKMNSPAPEVKPADSVDLCDATEGAADDLKGEGEESITNKMKDLATSEEVVSDVPVDLRDAPEGAKDELKDILDKKAATMFDPPLPVSPPKEDEVLVEKPDDLSASLESKVAADGADTVHCEENASEEMLSSAVMAKKSTEDSPQSNHDVDEKVNKYANFSPEKKEEKLKKKTEKLEKLKVKLAKIEGNTEQFLAESALKCKEGIKRLSEKLYKLVTPTESASDAPHPQITSEN